MKINNLTQYTKNYTKIFKNWVETRTVVPDYRKKKNNFLLDLYCILPYIM